MCTWRSLMIQTTLVVLMVAIIPDCILALRNVSVTIPLAVKRGDNAILICNYDIENDTLYTVKWYRGRREFYRYTPKENPAWKIFSSTNGLNVDTTQSNASHVFLRNASTAMTGRYACEVSADAPTFHTSIMWGEMDIIEFPTQRPIITGIHSRYRLGDVINGNCSSDFSKPAANLTWWINDIQVPPNYLRTYEIQKHVEQQLETSVLEINFIVTLQHFIKGKLKLKCSARIHRIYHAETEKYLEEDRPRILASGRSPETFPYDHEFDLENGLYLTHYKNYQSSAQSNLLNLNSITRFMWLLLPTISSLLFIVFNKNILNPLRLVGQPQSEQQQQQKRQRTHTMGFVQNRETKRLLQRQRQRQRQRHQHLQQSIQQQKFRYCHNNYPKSNNNEDDYDYKNNGNDSDYNNNNNGGGKIRAAATLRKSPCKRNKNEIQNSQSFKCQRHVTIDTNTYTYSGENETQTSEMEHVLR